MLFFFHMTIWECLGGFQSYVTFFVHVSVFFVFLCFGLFFFSFLFFCLSVAGVHGVPDCVRVGSRRHFVTAALLIFATIKTPCGAQCSESQHWDSTHLDPVAHRTHHMRSACVFLSECVSVDVDMCMNISYFFDHRTHVHASVNEYLLLFQLTCVYMCVCVCMCVEKQEGRGGCSHKAQRGVGSCE